MQRWTARFLLLFALAGTFLPLALQGTAAPAHLCCRRSGEHHCHSYALTDPGHAFVRTAGCNHDCCRGARTTQVAQPEATLAAALNGNISFNSSDRRPDDPDGQFVSFRSSRAPPQLSIS